VVETDPAKSPPVRLRVIGIAGQLSNHDVEQVHCNPDPEPHTTLEVLESLAGEQLSYRQQEFGRIRRVIEPCRHHGTPNGRSTASASAHRSLRHGLRAGGSAYRDHEHRCGRTDDYSIYGYGR